MGTKRNLKRLRKRQTEVRGLLPASTAKRPFGVSAIAENVRAEAELMLRQSAEAALQGAPTEHLMAKRQARIARALADELAEIDAGTVGSEFEVKVQKPAQREADENPEKDAVLGALQYAAVLIDSADALRAGPDDPNPTP